MARYFFDLSEGKQTLRDDYGLVCYDDRAAIRQGWKALAEVVGDPTAILAWQHAELNIRRNDGIEIARVRVTVEVDARTQAARAALNGKP